MATALAIIASCLVNSGCFVMSDTDGRRISADG